MQSRLTHIPHQSFGSSSISTTEIWNALFDIYIELKAEVVFKGFPLLSSLSMNLVPILLFNITIIAHCRSHHYHSDDNWHGDYHQTHDGVHQQNHKGEHYQTHDGDCHQTHDGNHCQNHDGKHFQETCCQRRRSWCWSTLPIRWSYLLP